MFSALYYASFPILFITMKMSRDKLFEIYNKFAREQSALFVKAKGDGVEIDIFRYFPIEKFFFDLLDKRTQAKLDSFLKKAIPSNCAFRFWDEFVKVHAQAYFAELKRRNKIKSSGFQFFSIEERIEGGKLSDVLIVNSQGLLSAASKAGLNISTRHLHWYKSNGLISPMYSKEGEDYYAMSQIYDLGVLHQRKILSLDTGMDIPKPDRTTFHDEVLNWQEYLLLNKSIIKQSYTAKQTENMHKVLSYVAAYQHYIFFKPKVKRRPYSLELILSEDSFIEGLLERLPFTEQYIENWVHEMMDIALLFNPLLAYRNAYPPIGVFLSQIERKKKINYEGLNAIALGNFYYSLTNRLLFVYNAITKKRLSLTELFKSGTAYAPDMGWRWCANPECNDKFIPNKVGKTQEVCHKPECAAFLSARREQKRNKNEKNARMRKHNPK